MRKHRHDDFPDGLADLDELRGAGLRMRLELPSLGPAVGTIMMIDVAQQWPARRAMDDDADVSVDANGPEVLVFGFVEAMEAVAGVSRVHLEIEGGGLDGLLLFGRRRQAICERGGEHKHQIEEPSDFAQWRRACITSGSHPVNIWSPSGR